MWLSHEHSPAATAGSAEERAAEKVRYARRHLALTRACVEIDGFLKGAGVIGLLRGEREHSTLNSALVAVLGLAVKKQDVGFGLFTTPAGHAHLKREFMRYFELSPDRTESAAAVAAADAAIVSAERALARWTRLEPAP
ncbi:hypothetical protein [Xanthomonas arboricola]|uniref:hypothetical protein n=1 Tax=Xanthomonas arboricola TaxID=56448 RepID=UPI000CEEA434|nr:hypothetical protein [Xanthomonas arboricola]PPU38794.1 hypothetical protein XaplCFBP3123_17725 [Xanthomonas arboricola pv. populi]